MYLHYIRVNISLTIKTLQFNNLNNLIGNVYNRFCVVIIKLNILFIQIKLNFNVQCTIKCVYIFYRIMYKHCNDFVLLCV